MTIRWFAEHQNDVFVPALIAMLVATAVAVAAVVLAPSFRGRPRGRPLLAAAAVLAAAALVVAGWSAGGGARALEREQRRVQAELRDGYGLEVDAAQVDALIDGDAVRAGGRAVRLEPVSGGGDRVEVVSGGRPLPRQP